MSSSTRLPTATTFGFSAVYGPRTKTIQRAFWRCRGGRFTPPAQACRLTSSVMSSGRRVAGFFEWLPARPPAARLLHIRDEIEGVAMIVRGLSFAQYQGSYIHRRAVERAVQIISESREGVAAGLSSRKYPQCGRGARLSGSATSCDMKYQRLDDKQLLGNRNGSPAQNCSRSWCKC